MISIFFSFVLTADNSANDYLLFSTEKGYLQHVKKALQQGASVNSKDYFRRTPLMYAVISGNEEIVNLLFLHGASANINTKDRDGNSALDYARKMKFKKIEKILLEFGAASQK
ncbi:MAG: ankyrin repeat domain-containing protein [Leptospiraceae bacterium]|nr:ankyrin repeat domain-containing protein [Leptospiraceae bacterium]MCP5512122.1 ankyrin repeat domain-containing protein [Leptospiraceae bacterium]